MNELAIALVSEMQADTAPGGLNAGNGATGGFHRGRPPEMKDSDAVSDGPKYPRITFEFLTGLPKYVTTGEAFRKHLIKFTSYAVDGLTNGGESGPGIASRLNKRVQDLFTDNDLSITGHDLLYCRPERELPADQETERNREIYSEACVIEIWTARA